MSEPTPEVQELTRLDPTTYLLLTKSLPSVGIPKTDLEAGFMCGVQYVLQKLRDGFVTRS